MKLSLVLASIVLAFAPAYSGAVTLFSIESDWRAATTGTINETTVYGSVLDTITGVNLNGGGALGFSPSTDIAAIGDGWATWSGGYTGQVLTSLDGSPVTLTLSDRITALGFWVEPFNFGPFLVTLTEVGGQSISQQVNGNGGAAFFGAVGAVSSLTISVAPAADGFAFGDILSTVPEPSSIALLAAGILGLGLARQKAAQA